MSDRIPRAEGPVLIREGVVNVIRCGGAVSYANRTQAPVPCPFPDPKGTNLWLNPGQDWNYPDHLTPAWEHWTWDMESQGQGRGREEECEGR